MPYKVSFHKKDGIVYVKFLGSAVKEDHYAAFEAACQLCKDRSCSRLIVDFSDVRESTLSTLESFTFGEVVANTPRHLYIAHVLPKHAQARENVNFASTVEANRGKATGEFDTVEQARQWLLGIKG